jgi:hypothetical protein
MIDKNNVEQAWISLILRVAVASIFGVAAFGKFSMGLGNYAAHMMIMFQNTFLPGFLLKPYIWVLPFAESLIVLWLLSGVKLREAWVFTAFVLLTLGFGMIVAQQGTVASENFIYMLIACLGVYMSKYDGCRIGG